MILLLKNCLLRNNRSIIFWLVCFYNSLANAQTANQIFNGSFEERYNCDIPYDLRAVKNWSSIDSTAIFSGAFFSNCNGRVPVFGNRYQYPKTGETYIISNFYNVSGSGTIGYLKNRLKTTLQSGKTYCVKFHVNIVNLSPRGMDGFGIYFGDDTIDTITKCNRPLTYLTPQVANPLGNVITDTLNWVPITGTFVANGTEKFALIGNFLADNAVTTAPINTPYFPQVWTDVLIDDVSCIDLDLPAFAGRDTACVTGNTVYIGRSRDVGIDEACTWFQLPDMNTVIATGAGFMVSPNGITSYVVRQEICGNVKWDTVTVTENPVGFQALKINDQGLKMYPIPAGDQLIMEGLYENDWLFIEISDMSGRHVLSQHVQQEGLIAKLELSLMNGAYLVKIKFGKNEQAVKKLLIAK